ncbi:MAG: hypothetical protein NVS3B12_27580 [Acidimicrobiales bacterium]
MSTPGAPTLAGTEMLRLGGLVSPPLTGTAWAAGITSNATIPAIATNANSVDVRRRRWFVVIDIEGRRSLGM